MSRCAHPSDVEPSGACAPWARTYTGFLFQDQTRPPEQLASGTEEMFRFLECGLSRLNGNSQNRGLDALRSQMLYTPVLSPGGRFTSPLDRLGQT